MHDLSRSPFEEPDLAAHYRVDVLVEPRALPAGIEHGPPGARTLLRWSQVAVAHAAEVGEPEGVRAVVVDLATERSAGVWEVARLHAEPGEAATELARAVEAGLGPERAAASIKTVATDGISSRWFPDLESLDEANLAQLLEGGSAGP